MDFSVIRFKVENKGVKYFSELVLQHVCIGSLCKSRKHLFEKTKKKILTPWIRIDVTVAVNDIFHLLLFKETNDKKLEKSLKRKGP